MTAAALSAGLACLVAVLLSFTALADRLRASLWIRRVALGAFVLALALSLGAFVLGPYAKAQWEKARAEVAQCR